MDTDRTPDGGPTTASRQTYVSGNAARLAARTMREQMQAVLAEKFDVPPEVIAFHEGLAYVDEARLAQVRGSQRQLAATGDGSSNATQQRAARITFAEAVQAMLAEGRDAKLRYEYWAPKTQPLGTGGDMHFAFSYAVHAALVSVDMETGEVAVEKVVTAHDVGRAINPLSLSRPDRGRHRHGHGQRADRALHRGEWRALDPASGPVQDAGHQASRRRWRTSSSNTPRRTVPMAPRAWARSAPSPSARPSPTPSTTRWACAALALPIDQDALLLAMQRNESELDARWGDPPVTAWADRTMSQSTTFWETLPRPIIGLSPMNGVTDHAFRHIQKKHGNPMLLYTEFTSVDGICAGASALLKDFLYDESQRPIIAQIYGRTPGNFHQTAMLLCQLGFDGIDINMGCPSRSIAHSGSGAGLIRTPSLAQEIVRATRRGVQDWLNGATVRDCADVTAALAATDRSAPQTAAAPHFSSAVPSRSASRRASAM